MALVAFRGPPSVEVAVDEDRRRIHVCISGPATGPLVAGRISRLFRDRPDLVAYDMLYDLSAYTGDVAADDVDPIVDAYADGRPDAAVPCRTAFLTPDRNFQHWASAMDEQFPGREHRAFPQLMAATNFLDIPPAERRYGV